MSDRSMALVAATPCLRLTTALHSRLALPLRCPTTGSGYRQRTSRPFGSTNSSLMRRHVAQPARRPAVRAGCCWILGACSCCQDTLTGSCKPSRNGLTRYTLSSSVIESLLRTDPLSAQSCTEIATDTQYDRAGNAIQMADQEIARFRAILQQIDELETEFDKIKRIREIVRSFRARVEQMERRLG